MCPARSSGRMWWREQGGERDSFELGLGRGEGGRLGGREEREVRREGEREARREGEREVRREGEREVRREGEREARREGEEGG